MITTTSETQFGYMPGRSTVEAIYLLRIEQKKNLLRRLIEKVQRQEERSPHGFYRLRKSL